MKEATVSYTRRSVDDPRLLYVFIAAFVIRFLLQFTSLPDALADRIEVSTPVTSFKKLKEGFYLYDHGIDPYDGGICHQAPILLALLTVIESFSLSKIITNLLFASLDLLSCIGILAIARSPFLHAHTKRLEPAILAAIALLNPLSILTAVSRSTAGLSSLAIIYSLSNALEGRLIASMLCLAFATYLAVYPIFLIAPLVLVASQVAGAGLTTTSVASVSAFLFFLAAMLYSSFLWLGSWNFLWSNYSIVLLMTDLTPNVGLWWYFFTEMFEDFRNFFLSVFQLHLLIYVVPLCIRLRKSPAFVCVTLCGLSAIFKPYPSIADTSLYLTLLSTFPHLFEHTRYSFLVACALSYCCIFGPAFYYLWIHAGSGNANFFYAITLVWNLTQGILLTDTVFANLKDEWEAENIEERKGQQLEVVQIAE